MVTQAPKRPAAKAMPATTVDEYLAAAPRDQRDVLIRIRKTIRAAAPEATERFAYGMVGFKHHEKPLVHLAYWKSHCALYGSFDPDDPELKGYELLKGTIQFPADRPLSDRLVTKLVGARIAAINKEG